MRTFLITLFTTLYLSLMTACAGADEIEGSLKEYEYWDNGNIKECRIHDSFSARMARVLCGPDGKVERVEKFDNYGNRIEEAFYDEKGDLRTGVDGWAAMRWRYDDRQLVAQISYDELGMPIERKVYSEGGNLIAKQYVDRDDIDQYEEINTNTLFGNRSVAYYDPYGRLEDRQYIYN